MARVWIGGALLAAGALGTVGAHAAPQTIPAASIAAANRVTWGVTQGAVSTPAPSFARPPADSSLPPEVAAQIAAMRISREPMAQLVQEMDAQQRATKDITDPAAREAAKKAWQQDMNDLLREAQARALLRDVYSPAQLTEQMGWFWSNLFSVHAQKRDIRAMVGDYQDVLRAHALGSYRGLLEASLRHPAMLRYLDNDQNAAGKINENYAREIMELHSMGVGSGYTQKDVQELARILTGVGVSIRPDGAQMRPQYQQLAIHDGLFQFDPRRHDFGDKQFLGHTIHGSGFGEVEQALDLIAASPATAHHVSTKIAEYFVGDNPAPALTQPMSDTFLRTHGDISAVLRAMFAAPEYQASLATGFKDPVHYVVSAVRYAYDGRVILNARPMINWLNQMGEGLYMHETPDGYPLGAAAWSGPGQMETRFEIARAIGNGSAGLFRSDGAVSDQPAFPQMQNALYYNGLEPTLAPQTRATLAAATTPQEWNMLLLASPDFMKR